MKKILYWTIAALLTVFALSGASCASAMKSSENGNLIVLSNFTLIDGTGALPVKNKLMFIKDGKVEKIVQQKDAIIPSGYRRIDLKGYTVLPGFINTHVHCFYSEDKLQNWLKHGVTTVRDMASRGGVNIAQVRTELNKNLKNARLVAASPMFTAPGGYTGNGVYVDSPEQARNKIREILKLDPDIIKIAIEDNLQQTKWNMLTEDEIKSITKTAHEGNKRVTAHISHVRNLRLAIDGGVDELAHMVVEPMGEDLAKEIARRNIYWIPTLELWQNVSGMYKIDWDQKAIANLSEFYKAGGKIALGTDYGGYFCAFDDGMPMTEIRLMKKAGMSNKDIIVAATKNAAYVCGMGKSLGTLEKGKIADLIVVRGNPLSDLETLQKLHMVIHNGKVAA